MENIFEHPHRIRDRDVFYYRQRNKNRVFEQLVTFFAAEAERTGVTKKDIAERLNRDPSQITRWLSAPNNLTADSISDLLLALGAEMDYEIVKFADRAQPNFVHDLMPANTAVIYPTVSGTTASPLGVGNANGTQFVQIASSGTPYPNTGTVTSGAVTYSTQITDSYGVNKLEPVSLPWIVSEAKRA